MPTTIATKTVTEKKEIYILNTQALSQIKVVPNPDPVIIPTEKPLLAKQQKTLVNEELKQGGGILVALQEKSGAQFVSSQDEITVKRGNQFFSISNQSSAQNNSQNANSPQNQSNKSSTQQTSSTPKLEINANNVIARSDMALSIDPLSGILTVDTPNGPQKVTIMPDEALGIVQELRALHTEVQDPTINLVTDKGILVYTVKGEKLEKFFGLLPVSIQKELVLSADTGGIIRVNLPIVSRLLSFFTF